jgi:hypothetical protein
MKIFHPQDGFRMVRVLFHRSMGFGDFSCTVFRTIAERFFHDARIKVVCALKAISCSSSVRDATKFTQNLPSVLPDGNAVHVDSTAWSDCRRE